MTLRLPEIPRTTRHLVRVVLPGNESKESALEPGCGRRRLFEQTTRSPVLASHVT
jgi:hypothetical protein